MKNNIADIALLDDWSLCQVYHLAQMAGYAVSGFSGRGEFPEGCEAARITGPHFPENSGLPFCVPDARKEVWAVRAASALGAAFFAGMCKANALNKSEYAIWAHELARLIVSEVRTEGSDDEKVVQVALMIRGEVK
jgi:hypothetical protein